MLSQVKSSLVLALGLLAVAPIAQANPAIDRSLRSFPRRGRSQCSSSPPVSSLPGTSTSALPTSTSSTPTTGRPSATPTKTGIPSGPDPGEQCYRPTPSDFVDYDQLCKCDYYDPESAEAGSVRCWVTCNPYKPDQYKSMPEYKDSLSACIIACQGSHDKAKRAAEAGIDISKRQDEYWFCHAVNFAEGQLCEHIGAVGGIEYTPWAASCWQDPYLGTG
ncbi:hypothetical protein F5Y08DRAFT_355728 [Xylaria arbuscula]|nr:hypothetical protein F5Y08DRAFT_355728 [Xylaria arbuscula]